MNKSFKSYTHLGERRAFLQLLVFEHFKLDMCTYGCHCQKKTTDVFYREGAKIPEIHCTEIAVLISKGINEIHDVTNVKKIFEASLIITNFPVNSTLDTLKKELLRGS